MDDNGNGSGEGRAKAVSYGEYSAFSKSVLAKLDKFETAMWGEEGTSGMIGDIRDLKNQSKLVQGIGSILLGVASTIVTTLIIKFMGLI